MAEPTRKASASRAPLPRAARRAPRAARRAADGAAGRAVSNTVLEERVLLGYGTRSWSHLTPDTYQRALFERHVEAVERDLAADAALAAAVRGQEGAAARALECAQEGGPPLAACVRALAAAGDAVSDSLATPLPRPPPARPPGAAAHRAA